MLITLNQCSSFLINVNQCKTYTWSLKKGISHVVGSKNFIQCATIRSEWTPDHQLHKCPPVVAINGNEHRKNMMETSWKHHGTSHTSHRKSWRKHRENTMETPVPTWKSQLMPAISNRSLLQLPGRVGLHVTLQPGLAPPGGRFLGVFWVKMPENPRGKPPWKNPWKLHENLVWTHESTLKMLKTSLSSLSSPCKRRCILCCFWIAWCFCVWGWYSS